MNEDRNNNIYEDKEIIDNLCDYMIKEDKEDEPIIIEQNKDKKNSNLMATIIVVLLIGLVFFFASNESIKDNKAIINQVSDAPLVSVEVKDVERGEELNAKEVYVANIESVVGIKTESDQNIFGQIVSGAATGTGFIISENGYILTNYHVIEYASKIEVSLFNEETYPATIVGSDKDFDIAILKIEKENLKSVTLGDSNNIVVGDVVYTIGHPLGELTYTLTDGIISAKGREIMTDASLTLNMFQTNAAMNHGNSGGPIFNSYGEVIGIATAKYSSDEIEGIGFGVPINDTIHGIDEIIKFGRVTDKIYLGIVITSVPTKDTIEKNIPQGALIIEVSPGVSADNAGLKVDDVIVKIDDYEIKNNSELMAIRKYYKANDTAVFKVYRDGEYLEIDVTFDTYDEIAEASIKEFEEEQIKEQLEEYEKALNGEEENEEKEEEKRD